MSTKYKVIIFILVAAIIGIAVYLGCTYAGVGSNNTNTQGNTIVNNVENKVVVENNTVEENKPEVNTVTTEPPVTEPVKDTPPEENSELESDSDEEKAIAIVKKDWGDTTGLSVRVEQINGDGGYVVSVRNEDANALEWYTVYPKTGKFTK